jgi:type II secretory pathway component GspD/PulD (secretin)
MKPRDSSYAKCARQAAFLTLAVVAFSGCSHGPADISLQPAIGEQRVFELKETTPEQGKAFLSELGLGTASVLPDRNAITVAGSVSDLHRASVLLGLVDTRSEYVISTIAPVSAGGSVPTNKQIGAALGGVAIGTFANPPDPNERIRGIIDIHGDSIVAIVPARSQERLLAFVKHGPGDVKQVNHEISPPDGTEVQTTVADALRNPDPDPDPEPNESSDSPMAQLRRVRITHQEPNEQGSARDQGPPSPKAFGLEAATRRTSPQSAPTGQAAITRQSNAAADESQPPAESSTVPQARRSSISQGRASKTIKTTTPMVSYGPPVLANGEDVLQLDLPERLEMIQLLDLAAEYLNLDYMCDMEKIRGQWVSLRLHGKLRGEIKVKDLYPLLESILKFKGYAMTCHTGGLVTIVPVADALQVDPVLVDPNSSNIEAGDMVVTRVFDLQYVNTASAMSLLENMKLSVAVSPIEENRSLIVTCYAHRMARIERLLSMIDKPGRPKEFRFRQLKYTLANTLTKKVETLVAELKTMPATVSPAEQKPSVPVLTVSAPSPPSLLPKSKPSSNTPEAADKHGVYLDADERTNRILMIGQPEQLAVVEEVIEALDVAQHDPRVLKTYAITHLSAADAKKKLEELGIVGKAKKSEGASPPIFVSKTPEKGGETGTAESVATEEMQVTVLEATNSLLVNATEEQHARITAVLEYVDVVQQDMRTLKVYELKYVGAEEVRKQLAEFELVGKKAKNAEKAVSSPAAAGAPVPATATAGPEEQPSLHEPQVSVLESTNSLLVNATEFQHARIAAVIKHVDTAARDEAIPYEIYFLENQEPEHVAEILQKILQETIKDKDAKIEKVVRRIDEEIVIVPDKNTFSLIVYASMKNQEWIGKLVKTLDKRRPQVLIDATLVEITKSDAFTYDLNLLGSSPDVASTSSVSSADPKVVGKLAQSDSGTFTAFYGDEHIQALLKTMQSKNYGRVLAKPKILVNDNESGKIKTTDITYVETSSSIPITSGAAGSQTNLVQTAVKYEEYEAGIMLDITPHISEGNLLRLDVSLTRSDFLETSDTKKPPNKRSNEVTTKVTVPDGSTIILGGLLKLNQNKGGTKVPILGDVPLIGGLFRGVNNKDTQDKLYVFVKAEIIRPTEHVGRGIDELTAISQRDREAFEKHEQEFQKYEDWPGIKSKPVDPPKVLDAR